MSLNNSMSWMVGEGWTVFACVINWWVGEVQSSIDQWESYQFAVVWISVHVLYLRGNPLSVEKVHIGGIGILNCTSGWAHLLNRKHGGSNFPYKFDLFCVFV